MIKPFRDNFGLDVKEIIALKSTALEFLDAHKSILARRILEDASPETIDRIRNSLNTVERDCALYSCVLVFKTGLELRVISR